MAAATLARGLSATQRDGVQGCHGQFSPLRPLVASRYAWSSGIGGCLVRRHRCGYLLSPGYR